MDLSRILFMWTMSIMISFVCVGYHEMEVNYDIGHYKFLHVNQTLELICKNLLNRDPPSWTYHSRLYNDPRMRFLTDVGESRLVITKARPGDAGQYRCSIDHHYNGRTFYYNRTIEVIVIEISDLQEEKTKDGIKLLCSVQAYPSPTVIWKIDYDNKTLNPQPEEPGEDDYWIPPEEKVVVDKSEGRWTLRPYKGVNNAELIIADVTENDNGKYYCVARNLAGEQSKNCTVRVTLGTTGSKSIDKDNTANHEVRNPGEQREDGVHWAAFASGIVAGIILGILITWHRLITNKRRRELGPVIEYRENSTPLNVIQPNQEEGNT